MQRGVFPAQPDERAVEIQQRLRILELCLHIPGRILGVDAQPGFGGAEAGIRARVPLHWGAAAVAAFNAEPFALADRVLNFGAAVTRVAHADFLAIIQVWGSAQGQMHACQQLQTGVILTGDVTGGAARGVVVIEEVIRPVFLPV